MSQIYVQPTAPSGVNEGDVWINSGNPSPLDIQVFQAGQFRNTQTLTGTKTFSGVVIASEQVFARKGRPVAQKLTVTTDATAGNVTYTAAQMLGGLILRDPAGAARSDVTPTAALLVAGLPGVAVDDVVECIVVNTADAAEVLTITAGTGVTLVPASVTPTQNEIARLLIRFTNVTASSEACTIYAIASPA